ncbi:Nucleolar complex protein 2 [Babesia sp. Xinjiang]|uniref:Nucleolar complex protein 2 n=1 Tax=Babesia sp. Xinjiang TaxID=462227 RepID=UPI000A22D5FF|nr:Nucleolar complex protein 2 [Babesia sp. Xinjiang]ORM41971.1 Nucleolar complex protein 2 [Babesia sp. Xinjiang]
MDTNIVNSRKKRRPHGKQIAKRRSKCPSTRVKFSKVASTVDNDESENEGSRDDVAMVSDNESKSASSDEGSDDVSGADIEVADELSDLSEYDMDDVSDDESDSDSENLQFSDSEDSDSEFDGDVEAGCRIVSADLAEKLLKEARKLTDGAVRRLVAVYGSFIRRVALQRSSVSIDKGSKSKDADASAKKKGGKRGRVRSDTMASRGMSTRFRETPNRYAPSNNDVYSYIVIEAFSIVEEYLRRHELSFSNTGIVDVATLFRKFLSSVVVQLGFCFEDLDLCRCALNTLGGDVMMPWIVSLKTFQKEVVKVACSLLTHHKERVVRIHALKMLQRYLMCVREENYHRIHISQTPAGVMKVERMSSQQVHDFCNNSLNFVLSRSYRTLVSASCIERTLKNFALFKLSQNCLAELFSEASAANLYTFAFKSIRDLGINVRREWLAINDQKKRKRKPQKAGSSHSIVLPVYSWGFVDAINLWVSALVRCSDRLEPLSYPLVTVISAAVKIKMPQMAYMPFVLHMLTALNQLADGLERFVPLGSYIFNLLEQLRNKDISKMQRNEAKQSRKLLDNTDDIMVLLRLSKKQKDASETYRMLYKHVALVLTDHVGLVALHPSFPEFTVPITAYLRRYLKSQRVEPGFRSSATKLLSLMDESATVVLEKRSSIDLEQRGEMRLKHFASEAKQIPVYRYRMTQLVRYQHINKEKVEGTLSAAAL